LVETEAFVAETPDPGRSGTGQTPLIGARQRLDVAYGYLAGLFIIGVVAQFFLAGVGIFGIDAAKVQHAKSFDPHRDLGEVLGLIAVVMLILALIAHVSRRFMLETLVLVLLVEGAQHGLASAGDSNKWVGGLHALDGLVILFLALSIYASARKRTPVP
jgi:type IV secretory pathway TrbD component